MKKIIITIILLVAAINVDAQNYDFSAVCSTGQTLYYRIKPDSTVSVVCPRINTGVYNYIYWYGFDRPVGHLEIPDSVQYNARKYLVTSISEYAFKDCPNIQTLVIPDNITDIYGGFFRNCTGLDSIIIGCGVQTLPYLFLSGCPNLKYLYVNTRIVPESFMDSRLYNSVLQRPCLQTVFLGDSVQTISKCAFYGQNSIVNLTFSEGVSYLCDSSFYGCSNISSLAIPNSVTQIGASAFYGCFRIDSLHIGSGIQSIGAEAFSGCTGMTYMYYNARNYGDSLFAPRNTASFANTNTEQFTTLVIGDSVDVLPANAFRNCTSINNLSIGSGLEAIPDYAFYGCSGLNTVTLPDNIISIGVAAFSNCTSLHNMSLGTGLETIGSQAFNGCSGLDNIVIPNSVSSIGTAAYKGCTSATGLSIGTGVTHIGNQAFYGCSNISSLVIPDSITQMGASAFYGCSSIDSLHIGAGITSIADSTFFGCSNISSITIPNGIKSIGTAVFMGCTSASNLTLGTGLSQIGTSAFKNCDNILSVTTNARTIGSNAFANCGRLSSVTFGDSVHTIGSNAFYNCDSLASLVCNANQIGPSAFDNCDNLLSVTTNARTIGSNAFANCDRLVSVTLGDSVQTVGAGAFNGDFRLQTVRMGNNITSLGDSVFQGCVRLTRPELPANLQSIGTRAFDGCSEVSGRLTFPAGVTSIGDYAFNGIGSVTEIEMKGSTPPTIYAHTFASVSNSTPVALPCGSVLNYYTTDYWENFSNIVEAPPFLLSVATNNEVLGTVEITQQPTCSNYTARIAATANTGYHFLRWDDGNTANPRQINMTQDSSFGAIFVVNNSYITVHANDPQKGTVSGTGNYSYNAPVTITAMAYDGYHFLKWNDGNTSNPRYMAAICDTSFTAIFVSNVSTITVSNANPDWGNVSGSGVYYYQNLVSLTATPVYGYHFAQWNDGNTLNPRTVTVVQDSTFTAYFSVNTYSIVGTSNNSAMGSVSGGGSYTYLHEMSLTATPAYGYHFVQWNDQNTDNPRTITVTRDSAFTAQFAANSYTVTSEPNDPTMGSAYGSGTYNFNTTATLTAVAEYGYHFTQWSDGVTDNPRTVTVQNSATYTAQFEINSYILTVQSSNPAIGTTSGGGSYNYLTPVNITAIPNAGYHFTQWSDGNTDNPRLVSVTQNATYTAQFAINSYAVGVVSNNTSMGSVSGSSTYNHNATATLTATAYYGYHFVQWQDGNTDNPRSIVVTDSAQYTAQFDYNNYLITTNSSNVTLGSATGGGSYNYLSQVALMAVPVQHYHFTMWNDSIEDNPRTVTVTRDSTFTAHFAIDRHTVVVGSTDDAQGTVSGSDIVDYNTAVWISATANYGYHFTQWNDGNTQNPRRVVVLQDTVFTASFAPNQYSATCAVNDTVMGVSTIALPAAPQAGMSTYEGAYQTSLMVTATANYGYHFVQWSDGVTDNPRSFTLTRDTLFTAVFAINRYMLNVEPNDSTLGTVSGNGEYSYLSQITIGATAAPHSHFVQWDDGNTTNPRQVTVTKDTSFTAWFETDPMYSITVTANDTTRGSVTGGGSFYSGETTTITAIAHEHYYFSQWSDGVTTNPRVVTVIESATYTAVFEPMSYNVTITANDYTMGSVSGSGSYAYGSSVTIAAQPFDNYRFVCWSDGDTNATRVIVVENNLALEAQFERKSQEGIEDVEGGAYKVFVQQGHIIVEGVEKERVQIFDVAGRPHSHNEQLPTGLYMIRIDNRVTKKVVVM